MGTPAPIALAGPIGRRRGILCNGRHWTRLPISLRCLSHAATENPRCVVTYWLGYWTRQTFFSFPVRSRFYLRPALSKRGSWRGSPGGRSGKLALKAQSR